MRISTHTLTCVALLCAIGTSSSARPLQKIGQSVGVARAAAIHECALSAAKFPDYSWGNTEMYIYRACMAGHAERE
jgi:hypothetical protein